MLPTNVKKIVSICLLALLSCTPGAITWAGSGEPIRSRFEALAAGYDIHAGEKRLLTVNALSAFYGQRGYRPVWTNAEGSTGQPLAALLAAIEDSRNHGLNPEDYHQGALQRLVQASTAGDSNARLLSDLDLLASDAFLLLASHLALGKVDPVTIDPQWVANRRETNVAPLLMTAHEDNTVLETLAAQAPTAPGYEKLRRERKRFATLEHLEWPAIPAGGLIRPDNHDIRLAIIRERLGVLLDEAPVAAVGDEHHYDGELAVQVQRFQRHFGLEPDAVIGPATLRALNTSPAQRLRQIDVNLERWRWLPAELGHRYVLVNIAGFELRLVEDHKPLFRTRVVVGRDYRRTPVFSDRIRYLEFNPTWTVPPTLARRDILPQIQRDPDYLSRLGFTLYDGWGDNRTRLDPAEVDWSAVSARHFPFRLVQSPGAENALGQVKFMFPNRFNVYLHDTPSRDLFTRAERAFSSGCVRVENPMALAEHLLRTEPGWSRQRIDEVVASGRTRVANLRQPVPVHIEYWTAWVEDDGMLELRPDIYQRDGAVSEALAARSL